MIFPLRVLGAAALLALTLALSVAGCGGGGGEEAGGAATQAPSTNDRSGDDGPVTLHIGGVLPETGSLAFLGVPVIAGVRLAVDDVNAQGGSVKLTIADSATNPAIGLEGARRLVAEGAHVIVGATASAVSLAFIQTLYEDQVPQCSPANASPIFTTLENADFYFRTTAPDTAVSPVIADLVIATGATRVAIIGRADAWGSALDALLVDEFERLGAETFSVLYDPEATSFSAEVSQVVNYDPDVAINLGFSSDGTEVVRQLLEAGIGPERQFAATGLYTPDLPQEVDASNPSVLDGMIGITQTSGRSDPFRERLAVEAGAYQAYGAEGYDCIVLLALAARITGDPGNGPAMMEAVAGLTHGGVECRSYGECAALIDEGRDIDYYGVSGPINLSDVGDATVAVYSVHTWENGEEVTLSLEEVDLATLE